MSPASLQPLAPIGGPVSAHRPVLFEQTLALLAVRAGGTYVDATFGRGGHARGVLERLGPAGRLIAIDRDPQAVAAGRAINDPRFSIDHAPFSELEAVLAAQGAQGIDGVLIDLGVSSPQLDDPARGFSFRQDGPLDMRMDPTRGFSAREWLLSADEVEIAEVLKIYGEERAAVPIARAIAARRHEAGNEALRGTAELAALVAGVLRRRAGRAPLGKDPATRTFQAIRILVNSELEEVATVLQSATDRLNPGGRLVVIAFHSLEDRIVKRFFARESGKGDPADSVRLPRSSSLRGLPPASPEQARPTPRLRLLARVLPDAQEAAANPRARSAVLRGAERLAGVSA
jgi:16S rRNA (cytosine1402-N4)-methyltransferase